MYTKVLITLPKELGKAVDKRCEEIGLNRSECFRKAIVSFLGLDTKIEKKLEQKYGPIYKALAEENRKEAEEMLHLASEIIP
ncbi:MAG: hypothetical protein AUJ85_01665 [Elusimicrobia bacterium CG1_02_37_114]|nr:MAG: hypothetical protein AUJ85_01665 [Elusimicrobia bacterium CG1_02_37_114]PIV53960.1 MAG: hypothetical protein COS17_01005 [Elusimicrobia bacterium CG02_land_8_20_14_3_00_37_13]PIZ13742.1 MAG: hypothetical protein COY53_03255 [Elusimicrobia bacterium CG_4_10_14_0_8_um_filter_37_32]